MKKIKLADHIYFVRFKTQYDCCSTMLRFQEHYESPNAQFRKYPFDLETFMDWYAKVNGNFTYYSDWSGFNIPSYILSEFYHGGFDPLSFKEEMFLDMFANEQGEKFYIIATYTMDNDKKWEKEVIKHELAHALWYVNDEYKKQVNKILKTADKDAYDKFRATLIRKGYAAPVMKDEFQAYLVGPSPGMGDDPALKPVAKAVNEVFNYFSKDIKV